MTLRSKPSTGRETKNAKRRLYMAKPTTLRGETWRWLLEQGLSEVPDNGQLGPAAYEHGILHQPKLLRGTIVKLGCAVIARRGAVDLSGGRSTVRLVSLDDRSEFTVDRDTAIDAIAAGDHFEQFGD